jgi:tRNA(fMet)-specific endonuclease VapC
MPARYLLDTNTASYVIKGTVPRVRERILKVPTSDVAISVVTEAELRFGVRRHPEATRVKVAVEEFLRFVEIRVWDSEAARAYAEITASIESEGHPMGNLDLMIGAHAIALGAVLVTGDRGFRWVKGLKLEDWGRAGSS